MATYIEKMRGGFAGVWLASLLAGCAAVETAVSTPDVSLRNVQIGSVDFSKQTFILNFAVVNPNPFPLPVNHVSFGLKLNQQEFASGESVATFTIPANGESGFAVSVDLDLLRTAPSLLYTLRDGVLEDLPYELRGRLGVDIPFANRVSFRTSGEIRLLPGDKYSYSLRP